MHKLRSHERQAPALKHQTRIKSANAEETSDLDSATSDHVDTPATILRMQAAQGNQAVLRYLAQRAPNVQRWKEPDERSDIGGPPPNYGDPGPPRLSGGAWYDDFPTSVSTDDLTEPFKTNVTNFLKALSDAGATYTINATYRPPQRAYLMHYAYAIARNGMNPARVPAYDG